MQAVDFSEYELSGKYYGGSERKLGIIIDGDDYMLKYQKQTAFGKRNNHISEFIGSHVFEICGFLTHKTYLGFRDEEQVVACKDFNVSGKQFVPFNDVGESTLDQDKETYQYDYEDIMQMLRDNSKLTNVEETISAFWEVYILDALLGNFDRHGSNWGFMKENNRYTMAPVFDNGSSLFPNLVDEDEMKNVMDSQEETDKRIYKFPTSQVKLNGKKSSYYEVIHSLEFPECNNALVNVFKRINMKQIEELIAETPLVTDTQKLFYIHMIRERYNKIIKASYDKLMEKG
ncbi:MAG: HipA domain-containing protein [Lachnospiraceae bacterium]|nr:HipA domain-containing protein [Lachnospiraceae bacterium]